MDISVEPYKNRFEPDAYAVLAIDGVPLNLWLHSRTAQKDVLDLIPAQTWAADPADKALACELLTHATANSRQIVPLLICPDDLDFNCTVWVVEQEIVGQQVFWHRFGMGFDKTPNHNSVKWFEMNTSAEFELKQFNTVVKNFLENDD